MKTASPLLIQKIYDLIGKRYDLFSFYEGKAKEYALKLLDPNPGEYILNAGVGTGKEHQKIISRLGTTKHAFGLELSFNLARYSQKRTNSPHVQASIMAIPLQKHSFDALYCAFVFDLLSPEDIQKALDEFRRLIKPNGRLIVCSLTSGEKGLSRIITMLWEALFRISPGLCAGCRPINIRPFLENSGFSIKVETFITQLGVCSQVVLAVPVQSNARIEPPA